MVTLYLDQNYLSGVAKRKPGFRELEPVLRRALARGAVSVVESPIHARESQPRPDLHLLELLRELSGGRRLPDTPDRPAREVRRRMIWTIARELPERRAQRSDAADLDALALALTRCELVTGRKEVLGYDGRDIAVYGEIVPFEHIAYDSCGHRTPRFPLN